MYPFAPRVGMLILAAGKSSRMGQPKLLLPFRGEPLIAPVLRAALSSGCGDVPLGPVAAVVGPHSPTRLIGLLGNEPHILLVHAPDAASGQAASLRAGISRLLEEEVRCGPLDGICVLLGDQPLIQGALLRRLAAALADHPRSFIAPSYAGRRGNPVLIPRCFFPQALALRGDTGARPLLAGAKVHLVPTENTAVLTDVDTPEAYAALQRGETE